MPPEAQVHQIPEFIFLLRAGGFPYFALGLFLSLFGVVLVAIPKSRLAITIYALLSLLPGLLAMVAIYSACGKLVEISLSTTAPKPAEFAAMTAHAMSCGFLGILGTLLPTILAVVAFWRCSKH